MGSDIFDLIVILLLVFFSLRGLKNGFILEIASIIALIGGFTAANTLHFKVSPYMQFITNDGLRVIVTYILIFLCVMLAVSLIAHLLRSLLEKLSVAKWIDTLAGFLLGLAKGLFLCSLIILVVQTIFGNVPFLQNSHTIPYLTTLIERVREWMPDDLSSRLGFHA